MLPHDALDSIGCLIGVVKGNRADVVMEDVGLDDSVEELSSNETEFAINGSGCATSVCPGVGSIMRQRGIGVLHEGNGDWEMSAMHETRDSEYLPNQWFTHKYGRIYQTSRLFQPKF